MTETQLLQRLQNEFAGHIQPSNRIRDIRLAIAKHVCEQNLLTDKDSGLSIPTYITGARRHYLKSFHANLVAKKRLHDLQSLPSTADERPQPVDVFGPHLEVLRLRKEHQQIQAMTYYTTQTTAVGDSARIWEIIPDYEPALQQTEHHFDVDDLFSEISELRQSLEMAVLQANHLLQRERHLLSRLRTSQESNKTKSDSISPRSHALESTRAELTSWVEASLAKCNLETDESQTTVPLENSEISESDIEVQYQEYCRARTRLIQSVSALGLPLPEEKINDETPKNPQPQPAQSMLSAIERQHLPAWTQKLSLTQQESFLQEVTSTEEQRLKDELQLLSEESHLLPSYPLLKKSHQRTRSTIQRENAKQQEKVAKKLLESWKFANEAATISTSGNISKIVNEGQEANDTVTEMLDTMAESEAMWQRFKGTTEQPQTKY